MRYNRSPCEYCGKTNHFIEKCWELRARLDNKGLKLVKNGDKTDEGEKEVKPSEMYGTMKNLNEFLGGIGFGLHSMGNSTNN